MKIALVQMNSTIGDFEGNAASMSGRAAQALDEARGDDCAFVAEHFGIGEPSPE